MKSNAIEGIKLRPFDDLFEPTTGAGKDERQNLPLKELTPFKDQPFHLYTELKMQEMMDSIREHGVLMPILVRPNEDGGYEIIAGHNRVEASKRLGLKEIPATIRNLDKETATILMVDSNLRQREQLLPSEKAFAYRMKLEAIKRQGSRADLTSAQVVPKLNGKTAREVVAAEAGENRMQISRFIRLTYLIPSLLNLVDEGRMAFNPAVALSYLTVEQQQCLFNIMKRDECSPSLAQAEELKRLSQAEKLDAASMSVVMEEPKPQEPKISIPSSKLSKFFPKDTTPKQMEENVLRIMEAWYVKQQEKLNNRNTSIR